MTESKFDLLNYLSQECTIFKNEQVFEPTYSPKKLVHRDKELAYLANHFRSITFRDSLNSCKQVVIQGPVGSGKTAVAKHLGATLERYCSMNPSQQAARIMFFHLNCRRQKSWHSIFTNILRQLVPAFPIRGFSANELLTYLIRILEEKNQGLLLCLDEIDYILPKGQDMLYSLIRHHEGTRRGDQNQARISLILITRNPQFQKLLDPVLLSSLSQRLITFEPYTAPQLFDILSLRAHTGLFNEGYSNEIISQVANIASKRGGDARYAIELLWRSGKITDQEGSSKIDLEHLRRAQAEVFPVKNSIITDLSFQLKNVLLALAVLLDNEKTRSFVTTRELRKKYTEICKETNLLPRKQTQFWSYLQDLSQQGLIELRVHNRHTDDGKSVGRTSMIGISDIPVSNLLYLLK